MYIYILRYSKVLLIFLIFNFILDPVICKVVDNGISGTHVLTFRNLSSPKYRYIFKFNHSSQIPRLTVMLGQVVKICIDMSAPKFRPC